MRELEHFGYNGNVTSETELCDGSSVLRLFLVGHVELMKWAKCPFTSLRYWHESFSRKGRE